MMVIPGKEEEEKKEKQQAFVIGLSGGALC
jgi:hypothetical protein